MMSAWFLVLLGVCGLVGIQAQYDRILNPERTTEEELRVLVQLLAVRVEKLEKESEARGKAQVAFSASLMNSNGEWRTQGPHINDVRLMFQKVTTNIGNAYNPNTGIFTVPVKGLYYIRFTGMAGDSKPMNAVLIKNEELMFEIYTAVVPQSSASNGITLVLEKGDRLWVTLWNQNTIFDQSRLSTFSGFLVFPMEGEP
ncbi:complement C1q tumor necrosis factor-related protein 3-like [Archocentrus centrarchus]|uniref:complement C1q tumor necrosis factor-related protein 3-like n=1 Tax=Archocentrus centrarchus TaxID=63155 RepID=UPI0011E9C7D0|nr:complement C1q tumor necrosis factor-related protein 3-like [Archocentrus centrarchus]